MFKHHVTKTIIYLDNYLRKNCQVDDFLV